MIPTTTNTGLHDFVRNNVLAGLVRHERKAADVGSLPAPSVVEAASTSYENSLSARLRSLLVGKVRTPGEPLKSTTITAGKTSQ
jgi:hypothetical protein